MVCGRKQSSRYTQTSNNIEAQHNQFINSINQYHLNIYHFFKTLINENNCVEGLIQGIFYLNLKHISLSTKELEKKVNKQKAIENQTNKTVPEFLIDIASNFY